MTLLDEKYFTEKQIKLVLLFNNIMAGLGILDLTVLSEQWKIPIIILSEKKPVKEDIMKLLKNLHFTDDYSTILMKNPDTWIQLENSRLYGLLLNIANEEANEVINNLKLTGDLPEPLRIADLVAKAIL